MAGRYDIGKPEIDKKINDLAGEFSQPGNAEYMRQILTTAIKLYFDGANQADLKLLNTGLKELRHAFRIFSSYRDTKKVIIWGSARVPKTSAEYKLAEDFAKKITKKGFMVITGGGGGVMEAGNCGAGDKGFGVSIHLPKEEKENPYIKGKRHLSFHYFFTRKLIFVKESDAAVLFPGGFGTSDEAFEILTLAQTGKMAPRPIVLLEPKGGTYWKRRVKFIKEGMAQNGFISKDDLKLFTLANSAEKAIEEVADFYRIYHSIRYIGPLTVIRLNKKLSKEVIEKLNKEFKNILVQGKIEASPPRPEEAEDKDHLELPRISLRFNRKNYGRLYEMIRMINKI